MKNKKHIIIGSTIGVCLCLLSLFAVLPITTTNKSNSGQDWMKDVDDNKLITSLSLPGSHDSGATHSIIDFSGKCQDLSISEQLNIGARFFDIRLQLVNNELKVIHGVVDQKLTFKDTLSSFNSFIKNHPSETLFISIKKESNDKNSTISFEEVLKKSLEPHLDIWDLSKNIPNKLKDARGKIFLLSRYEASTIGVASYIGWLDPDSSSITNTFDISDSNLHVQDYYKVKDIKNKQDEIRKCFEYTSTNQDVLTLNFSSCYFVDSFPIAYAGSSAKIINNWLLSEVDKYQNLGIVVSDFLTSTLCEKIYSRNK